VAPVSAIARRAFADSRVRNLSFASFFILLAYVQPLAYRHSFPTLKERVDFARSFGTEKTVRFFYGTPHDLLSVGGYTAWRVAGLVSIFAAMWGLLAAVRALRAEEEAGRQELVLAGAVSREGAFGAALAAIGAGAALLWLALFLGLLAGKLPVGGSAYLALATVSPVPVFVGIGALASQLAPTRRLALELASGLLVAALLLRVVADTSASLGWLRWATPLGWAEELRPFAGPRPAVLLAPLLVSASLLVAPRLIAVRRDVGNGLLRSRDSAAPRLRLLSSPTAQALRSERGSLIGWLVGIGFFALIMGMISNALSSANLSENLQRQLHKLGASFDTPSKALGFYFLFFVLAIGLFAGSQIAAARREEADQQLETLFALPVGRRSWLAGRLLLASAAATALALTAGVLAWAGAESQGVGISLPRMLEAGANTLPAALLFLALGALAFALLPRASAGIAYALVSVAFVWQEFGSALGAPSWTLGLSPFHHIGLVPTESFKPAAAVTMLAIAAIASLAATRIFERRDLTGT
jgi:ABC-2 type transport system permease protein